MGLYRIKRIREVWCPYCERWLETNKTDLYPEHFVKFFDESEQREVKRLCRSSNRWWMVVPNDLEDD